MPGHFHASFMGGEENEAIAPQDPAQILWMPDNGVNSAIHENGGVNNAFSLCRATFFTEFATSQQDDNDAEHQHDPSSGYEEIEPVIVVEKKDHYNW